MRMSYAQPAMFCHDTQAHDWTVLDHLSDYSHAYLEHPHLQEGHTQINLVHCIAWQVGVAQMQMQAGQCNRMLNEYTNRSA